MGHLSGHIKVGIEGVGVSQHKQGSIDLICQGKQGLFCKSTHIVSGWCV